LFGGVGTVGTLEDPAEQVPVTEAAVTVLRRIIGRGLSTPVDKPAMGEVKVALVAARRSEGMPKPQYWRTPDRSTRQIDRAQQMIRQHMLFQTDIQ